MRKVFNSRKNRKRCSFTKGHDLRELATYFSDKYNWCHVIDIAPQLYMIVGLGIKLKSMSMRSWRWILLRLPQNLGIVVRMFLNRANMGFVLLYVMTDAYDSLRFSAMFSASLLLTLVLSHHVL